MPLTLSPPPQDLPELSEDRLPPEVTAAKGHDRLDDDFGDFNEEDFDDDFDDDFEEEMEDEYELSEIEGEVEVQEVDVEDLDDLPLDTKIGVKADDLDDGFDDVEPAAAGDEEEEEFEEEAE